MTEFLNSLEPWHFYFAIGVVLLGLEMLTFTFDLLWLGLGALAGALVAYFVPEVTWLPMLAAALSALAFTFFGRRWATRRKNDAPGYRDPIDDLVNRSGKVTEAIAPHHKGIVKVGSEYWSATSTDVLPPGEEVIVTGRSSTVLQVRRA